ncbi:unnamed protein product [Macrosiphum euphorbiae]|uniref:Transposable element P transposase n=1 Tax=Macrosiphum euphorbiae TaxID=13131 RepID=A0AAV0VTR4_9HEMI|nr:unnamed protein product [Macrosiphum euphorbiae]
MFQSLGSNFYQTIGCFASKSEVKGVTIAQLVLKAISLLKNIGISVDGIVCDGATTNRKMWSELGIVGSQDGMKNYFEHPSIHNKRVYAFSDFVHLFKCVRNRLYNNKTLRLHSESDSVAWGYYREVYKEDTKHPANLRIALRITPQHLDLTSMAKMRLRLCTQVLSMSMAKAMRYYKSKGCVMLKSSDETANFTEFWNNLFDNLNRNLPWQGLKLNDLDGFKDALYYIDCWENEMFAGHINPEEFLTNQTAEGLRITLNSTIDLSKYLLESCSFTYVLTGKMCQDPLEKFFGIIRQSCGPNDHPTTPTFLHLYKILSVLKPPKYGNCSVTSTDTPQISLADLHEIFHNKVSCRIEKINKLKIKLDELIEEGLWEPCDILPNCSNNEECSIRDSIVYYVCGFFKTCNANHPAAELVSLKTNGKLIYPNTYLYEFLSTVEHSFSLFCHEYDGFDKVVEDITDEIETVFIPGKFENAKVSREKKKLSKLYNS